MELGLARILHSCFFLRDIPGQILFSFKLPELIFRVKYLTAGIKVYVYFSVEDKKINPSSFSLTITASTFSFLQIHGQIIVSVSWSSGSMMCTVFILIVLW